MKKLLAGFMPLVLLLFCGCGKTEQMLERVSILRKSLQSCESCSFQAQITADYGEYIHTFRLDCRSDSSGNLYFTVLSPQTICGITGTITDTAGHLTFDGHVLAFEMLADGQASPVSAPWILLKALRGGYIRSCGEWEQGVKVLIDDSYQDNSMQLTVWMDEEDDPCTAEILWQGKRILSLEIENFVCQ